MAKLRRKAKVKGRFRLRFSDFNDFCDTGKTWLK
jgi:hypothetical protein